MHATPYMISFAFCLVGNVSAWFKPSIQRRVNDSNRIFLAWILYPLFPTWIMGSLSILGVIELICLWKCTLHLTTRAIFAMVLYTTFYYVTSHLDAETLLHLVGCTSLVDVGGFLGGRFFGHLTPGVLIHISPKKTLAGYLFSCLFAAPVFYFFGGFPWLVLIPVAVAGDLFFSGMKRAFGKHEGQSNFSLLLGSHGGILDRIDSHLFVVFFYHFFFSSRKIIAKCWFNVM